MPIQKGKDLGNGVSGNYWKINSIYISPDHTHARANVQLFTDSAAFLSGAAPLYATEYLLVGSDDPLKFKDIEALVDAKLITIAGDVNGGSVV